MAELCQKEEIILKLGDRLGALERDNSAMKVDNEYIKRAVIETKDAVQSQAGKIEDLHTHFVQAQYGIKGALWSFAKIVAVIVFSIGLFRFFDIKINFVKGGQNACGQETRRTIETAKR